MGWLARFLKARRTVKVRRPQQGEVWRRRSEVPPDQLLVPVEAVILTASETEVSFKAPGTWEAVTLSKTLFHGLYEYGRPRQ